jgi:hypothetical protein
MIAAKQLRSGMARCRPPYGGRGGWQQGLDDRPQLVWHEVVNEGRHGGEPAIPSRKERNDSLGGGVLAALPTCHGVGHQQVSSPTALLADEQPDQLIASSGGLQAR